MIDFTDVRQFPRQVHLDFHTSPLIPDVAADFDPDAFAAAFADAHVQSVTVFAKCHHGMSYYPTKVGRSHPGLRRPDLLGEMIEALHRRGIRAPVYTTVGWEEDVADRFPAWRQMRADGTFATLRGGADGKTPQAGGWRFNDWLHPDYQDYIEAHVAELLAGYPIDGLFFDILFHDRDGLAGDATAAFRREHGFTADDEATFVRFQSAAQVQFGRRLTRFIRDRSKTAGIFYNMPNVLHVDAAIGAAAMQPFRTQWEIESLPSGFWGYYHFPPPGPAGHGIRPVLARSDRPLPEDVGRLRRHQAPGRPGVRVLPQPSLGRREQRRRPAPPPRPPRPRRLPPDRGRLRPVCRRRPVLRRHPTDPPGRHLPGLRRGRSGRRRPGPRGGRADVRGGPLRRRRAGRLVRPGRPGPGDPAGRGHRHQPTRQPPQFLPGRRRQAHCLAPRRLRRRRPMVAAGHGPAHVRRAPSTPSPPIGGPGPTSSPAARTATASSTAPACSSAPRPMLRSWSTESLPTSSGGPT